MNDKGIYSTNSEDSKSNSSVSTTSEMQDEQGSCQTSELPFIEEENSGLLNDGMSLVDSVGMNDIAATPVSSKPPFNGDPSHRRRSFAINPKSMKKLHFTLDPDSCLDCSRRAVGNSLHGTRPRTCISAELLEKNKENSEHRDLTPSIDFLDPNPELLFNPRDLASIRASLND